jgi:hypothetical protein
MRLRKHVVGAGGGGFVKFLIGAVLFFVLMPKLLQCAQDAPRRLADAASKEANAAADSITEAPHRLLDAASKEADAAAQSMGDAASSAVRSTAQTAENLKCSLLYLDSSCTATDASPPPPPQPVAQPAAQQKLSACAKQDEAAVFGLRQAAFLTRCSYLAGSDYEREYAGNVYSYGDGKCFDVDKPAPGAGETADIPAGAADNPYAPKNRANLQVVGTYHSHPIRSTINFSTADLCSYVKNKKPGYVVATNKDDYLKAAKFDPNKQKLLAHDDKIEDCMLLLAAPKALNPFYRFWLEHTSSCAFLENSLNSYNPAGTLFPSHQPLAEWQDKCPALAADTTNGNDTPPTKQQISDALEAEKERVHDFYTHCADQ